MAALLVFYVFLERKRLFDGRGLFGCKVIKKSVLTLAVDRNLIKKDCFLKLVGYFGVPEVEHGLPVQKPTVFNIYFV